MTKTEELLAWVTLGRAPGVRPDALRRVLSELGGPTALIGASYAERSRAELPNVTNAYLDSPAARPSDAERRWLEVDRHQLVTCVDARYPRLLRETPDGPIVLYVSGNAGLLADPQLAVVGSRNPTPSGRTAARYFAESLGARGVAITSGLAEGIDACAHDGALRAGAPTVAVLGNGIDLVYPRCNRRLSLDIERHGALVSEFPLGTPPRRGNFPRRNRIIAALSLGVLVVEAARSSGSLITARLAATYGRDVFAVPGSIYSPMSHGCHELIKSGARLADRMDDILGELNFSAFFSKDLEPQADPGGDVARTPGMDKDRKILLDALGFDPVDLDALIVRTGFKPEAVSSMMLILELEGHVQAAPGGRYSRVANRRAGVER